MGTILRWDVGGINANYVNNITHYTNSFTTQPAATVAWGYGCTMLIPGNPANHIKTHIYLLTKFSMYLVKHVLISTGLVWA